MCKQDKAIKIVAILLVKNEERYIRKIINNIIDFCDRIIVADNLSTDNTAQLVLGAAHASSGKIVYHSITKPQESHDLIKGLAGSRTWVFAVDGDEIYDPVGLSRMREKIVAGDYDSFWQIFGNVLNCVELEVDQKRARGYLAPPCRSMTKLYNFNLIESWDGICPERLHGGEIVFKPGFSKELRKEIYKEISWEDAQLRCLHLCFLKRSKEDIKNESGLFVRKNISDLNSEKSIFRRLINLCRLNGEKKQDSIWKQQKYMRGELVEKDISIFF